MTMNAAERARLKIISMSRCCCLLGVKVHFTAAAPPDHKSHPANTRRIPGPQADMMPSALPLLFILALFPFSFVHDITTLYLGAAGWTRPTFRPTSLSPQKPASTRLTRSHDAFEAGILSLKPRLRCHVVAAALSKLSCWFYIQWCPRTGIRDLLISAEVGDPVMAIDTLGRVATSCSDCNIL